MREVGIKMKSILCILLLTINFIIHGQEMLPKGRTVVQLSYITTSWVNNFHSAKGNISPYKYSVKIDSNLINSIDNATVKKIMDTLKSANTTAHNRLTLGEYTVEGTGRVQAQIIGVGHAFSRKSYVYAGIPILKAKVNVNAIQKRNHNIQEIYNTIESSEKNNNAVMVKSFISLNNINNFNMPNIQSIITNYIGMHPFGDWQAQGPGDMRVGIYYRLKEHRLGSINTNIGVTIPTGKEDDPDILQDIKFGDGQYDLFTALEGHYIPHYLITLSSSVKYTYQFPSNKELRATANPIARVNPEKRTFKEKLGNITDVELAAKIYAREWFRIILKYNFQHKAKSKYTSPYILENKALASNTQTSSHMPHIGMEISSINAFLSKKFPLPMTTYIDYSQVVSGKNTPSYKQLTFNFRFFF